MTQLVTQSAKQATVYDRLKGAAMLETLRRVLPKGMTPERFIVIVQTEMRKLPQLADCPNAIPAFLQAAKLGLEPGVLGECWVLPFGKEAVLVPGYRGLAQLAWRSGMVRSLSARGVFEGDVFDYSYGVPGGITHKPCGESDPVKMTYAYAVLETTTGGTIFHVMTRKEIESRRARSRAGTKGPWVTDYVAMACKTAVLTLLKLAPLSVEVRSALALDDAQETGEPQKFDVEVPAMDLGAAEAEPEAPRERQPGEEE